MQVSISTWSRFHLFDLAEQLFNQGSLYSICSTLPRSKAERDVIFANVDNSKLHTYSPLFMLEFALGRILGNTRLNELSAILTTKTYQDFVQNHLAKNIENIDAYIAISGSGYRGGKLMVDQGKIYFFDRGSTEITHQLAVMKTLHERLSLPCREVAKWLIDNETKEAELATAITVPSSFCKKTFVDKGLNPDKIHVIPYGVNLTEFFREPASKTSSKNQILFCGQFSIRKGAHLLVDYFRNYPCHGCRLSVVGSVNPNLYKLFGSTITANIDFHGVVPRKQVRRYMQESKALILPSYEEGLALVMPQALACGIPVIASVQSGATEYIRDGYNGFILEDITTQSIHSAMQRLYSMTVQEQEIMSLNCIASVKDIGGWELYGKRWMELLSNLAPSRKS